MSCQDWLHEHRAFCLSGLIIAWSMPEGYQEIHRVHLIDPDHGLGLSIVLLQACLPFLNDGSDIGTVL